MQNPAETRLNQSGIASQGKLKVLIADDIQETRQSLLAMLSMNPNVVVVATARDGGQAVLLAKQYHPDIVIMDINMPVMNGLAAYKEISRIHPDIGCIIITAQKDIAPLGVAMTLGAQEYMVKPFTLDELNEAVDRVGMGYVPGPR